MKRSLICILALALACISSVSCNKQPTDPKTAVLIVGTKSAYWDKVQKGAMEEGEKQGLNVTIFNYPSDLAYSETAEYIKSLNNMKNIAGVAGLANEATLDAAYGTLREDIPIVVVEGVFIEGGAVSKRYKGTVALNYDEYGTALSEKIPETEVLVLSYDKGANAEIASVIARNKGAEHVVICPVADKSNVAEILSEGLKHHPGVEAVIFCSSNFVTDSNLSLCTGRTIYSSDLNAAVEPAIRDGRIKLNISIDNYEFGANLVRAIADIDAHKDSKSIVTYGIPFLFTDKSNIDSPERKRQYAVNVL